MTIFGLKKVLNFTGNLIHKRKSWLLASIGVVIMTFIAFSTSTEGNQQLTSAEIIRGFQDNIELFSRSATVLLNGFFNYDETVDPEGNWKIYFSREDLNNKRQGIGNRWYYDQFLTEQEWNTIEKSVDLIPQLLGITLEIAKPHVVKYTFLAEVDNRVVIFKYYDPTLSPKELALQISHDSNKGNLVDSIQVIEGTGWIVLLQEP